MNEHCRFGPFQRGSVLFFYYLSFTDAWFRELSIFTLPAVHPHSYNLTVYLLSFTSA